jgi:hypothetical protein
MTKPFHAAKIQNNAQFTMHNSQLFFNFAAETLSKQEKCL